MKAALTVGILTFFLLVGTIYPAIGQTNPIVDYVVINEIDINPPGDDSKTISEWVELYNPTATVMEIGGWSIASTTVLKKTLTIPYGTLIEPGRYLTYSYQTVWFTDVSERVELRDANGIVIDETPVITDSLGDYTSWQRTYDGYDTNSSSDWVFETSSARSSNGKLTTEVDLEQVSISLSLSKTNYQFGETLKLSGDVSEQVLQYHPFFEPSKIKITISGPAGYEKNINLYPDLLLKFETQFSLQKVLGITEGLYFVSAEYAGSTTAAQFSVGKEIIIFEEAEEGEFSITTDKESYIPGETATIHASTNEILPLKGLRFTVTNPLGEQIFDGTLYPSSSGDFSTSFFITTVVPVYGQNQIIAEYGDKTAQTSFEVTQDVKENKIISLNTDKSVYGLGDTVVITGRLNNLWIFSLDLEILQTGIVSLDQNTQKINKVLDAVRLEGDSSFRYDYRIPNNTNSYGDYRVTVSKEIGTFSVFFKVVKNPSSYVEETSKQFSVKTNKQNYFVNDPIVISGRINQLAPSSQYYNPSVSISIKSDDGSFLTSAQNPSSKFKDSILYAYTAVPDIVGNYEVSDTLNASIFTEGSYTVVASYSQGLFTDTTSFSVTDPFNISIPISVNLDKEVYGLGEQVKLSGIVAHQTQGTGLTITLLKPNGDKDEFGTLIDNKQFSWSWTTPLYEKPTKIKSSDDRSIIESNFGISRSSEKIQRLLSLPVITTVSPNP